MAKSPSFVIKSSPSESRSSRPTGKRRTPASFTKSQTFLRPNSSFAVVTYPRGLCSIIYTFSETGTTALPRTVTLSLLGSTFAPITAICPFTFTFPLSISSSAFRREATPHSARCFCSLILLSFISTPKCLIICILYWLKAVNKRFAAALLPQSRAALLFPQFQLYFR